MQNSLIIARILWPKNNFSEGKKKSSKKLKKKVGVKKKWGNIKKIEKKVGVGGGEKKVGLKKSHQKVEKKVG